MIGVSAIPLYSKTLRKFSSLFSLLGTGALAGILFFDLIPDIYQIGGQASLGLMLAVCGGYSVIHVIRFGSQFKNPNQLSGTPHSHYGNGNSLFFLLSMAGHCFASGILLVTAEGFSVGLNRGIFLALLAHKLYESLTVATVLIEKQRSRSKSIASILVYSLSLPVGVLLTFIFKSHLTPSIALIATSLAAGTLLGCLIFDFFIPSLAEIRKKWSALGWVTAGLFSAQVLLKIL